MEYILQALNTINYSVASKNSSYYNQDGELVPRVTEVISRMLHNDGLMYWANSLGFKGLRYRDVLNQAANAGTEAHHAIEVFLKEKIKTDSNIPFLGFLIWYNIITIDLGIPVEVIYIEHKISSKFVGGTLDALLRIGGKVYLIDFKTSNHVTFNYFLQLGAYKHMLKEVENIDIDGVIVLQLDKDEPGFNEYLLDFSLPDHFSFMTHCEKTFLSILYAFYNVSKAENDFKTVFKEVI